MYKNKNKNKVSKQAVANAIANKVVRAAVAPRTRVIKGKGFYKGFGRDLGSAIGGLASKVTGIPMLDKVGGKLGQWGANVTGWGAYKVNKNSLLTMDVPIIKNANRISDGCTVIRHREYIGDVVSGPTLTNGSTAFNIQYQLPLNPGMSSTFPWLAQVASNYSQYKVNGMLFEFISSCGDAISSTNSSLGEVIIATEYNSLNPAFTTKQAMLNEEFAVSQKPSQNLIHPIECDPKQTTVEHLYIRSKAPPQGSDLRLFDLGQVYVATVGQQAAGVNLGELYVTYEVFLYKPTLTNPLSAPNPASVSAAEYNLVFNDNKSPALGDSRTAVFDNLNLSFSSDDLSMTLPAGIPNGTYLCNLVYKGSVAWYNSPYNAVACQVPTVASGNATISNLYSDVYALLANTNTSDDQPKTAQISFILTVSNSAVPSVITFNDQSFTIGNAIVSPPSRYLPPSPSGVLYVARIQ